MVDATVHVLTTLPHTTNMGSQAGQQLLHDIHDPDDPWSLWLFVYPVWKHIKVWCMMVVELTSTPDREGQQEKH